MDNYIIYTDGSCKGIEHRKGGWSAIVCNEFNIIIKELYGGFKNTTNNRMEIYGVLEGLKFIKEPSNITIITDSQYVVNTINGNWIWKMLQKPEEYNNIDLWQQIADYLTFHEITIEWTKGHADNEMNNRADKLAQFVANALNLPEDEYINNSKENRESLVPELTTRRSNGPDFRQKNGTVLYSLGQGEQGAD